jgi:hypothetical protein
MTVLAVIFTPKVLGYKRLAPANRVLLLLVPGGLASLGRVFRRYRYPKSVRATHRRLNCRADSGRPQR